MPKEQAIGRWIIQLHWIRAKIMPRRADEARQMPAGELLA
jgi:hypothetical protein